MQMSNLVEITDPELLVAPEVPNNYFVRLFMNILYSLHIKAPNAR